jgi:histidine decarboxylase
MLTRRRFMGYSAAGILAAAAGCRPHNFYPLLSGEETVISRADPTLEKRSGPADSKRLLLGYPVNMNTPPNAFFAWREELQAAGIGVFAYNNVGNPFDHAAIAYNTHDFERELILRFGRLYNFPASNIWGFLSHSGTDSNMHGMYMGRTLLQERTGAMPICYFTREAHYSIQILRDLLGLETVFVDTLPDGGMDPEDLRQKLFAHPDHPALVVATIGTTFKGAVDRVERIQDVLHGHANYLHLDAALFGGYLPYTAGAGEVLHRSKSAPSRVRYDSIAISCHKFYGFPAPAGLFITTQSTFDAFNELYSRIHNPEYIGHVPGTITCSRDAVKPAEFFFFSSPSAMRKQAEDAQAILRNTGYLMDQMQTYFPAAQPKRANEISNTIYFKKPTDRIVAKYSLATMRLMVDGKKQDYAHIVVMPHADRKVLTEFLTDLERDPMAV